jgi:hypothetical protein
LLDCLFSQAGAVAGAASGDVRGDALGADGASAEPDPV